MFKKFTNDFGRDFQDELETSLDALNTNTNVVKQDLNTTKGEFNSRVDELINGVPQPSEVVDARGGHAVLGGRLNEINEQLAQRTFYYTPEMFGETGTLNDTLVIQTALDYINQHNYDTGAQLHFGGKIYNFDVCTIMTPNLTVSSSGLLDGSFIVQSVEEVNLAEFNLKEMNVVFSGVKFRSGKNADFAINFKKLRDATVTNCSFNNYKKAILSTPEVGFKWQSTARIKINNSTFNKCNECIVTEQDPSNGLSYPDWNWHQHGDYIVQGNYFYTNRDAVNPTNTIRMKGQDGLICKDNFFFHGYGATGSILILDDSNYAVIEGNCFFEASAHAIKIDTPRHLIIKGNQITICGQISLVSPIDIEYTLYSNITKEVNVVIDSNIIDMTTSHGIRIGGNVIKTMVSNNIIRGIGEGSNKGSDVISSNLYDVYVESGALLNTDAVGIKYKEDIVLNGNTGEKGYYLPRGTNFSYFNTDYLKAKRFFGNMVVGKTFNGEVDYNAVVTGANPNPINPSFPFIFKSCSGTISNITNANVNQILVISANSGGLTIVHDYTKIVTKTASNVVLTGAKVITLIKTDDVWYEI